MNVSTVCTRTGGRRTRYMIAKNIPIIKETLEHDAGRPKRMLGSEPGANGSNPQDNYSKANQISYHAICSMI